MSTDDRSLSAVRSWKVIYACLAMIVALSMLYGSPATLVLSRVKVTEDGTEVYGLLREWMDASDTDVMLMMSTISHSRDVFEQW